MLYTGATVEVVIEGLNTPSGLALTDTTLFISDYTTGEIIAFDRESGGELGRVATGAAGLMGITVGLDGRIWYVDSTLNEVRVIDPGSE